LLDVVSISDKQRQEIGYIVCRDYCHMLLTTKDVAGISAKYAGSSVLPFVDRIKFSEM